MEDKTIEELKSELKDKNMVINNALKCLKVVKDGAIEAFEKDKQENPDLNNYVVRAGYLEGGIKRVIHNLEREV